MNTFAVFVLLLSVKGNTTLRVSDRAALGENIYPQTGPSTIGFPSLAIGNYTGISADDIIIPPKTSMYFLAIIIAKI
jgi:hypothetical protein